MAKIMLDYGKCSPGDVPAVSGHFEALRDEWKDKVQNLTNLVDSATDTGKFMEACGKDSLHNIPIRVKMVCICTGAVSKTRLS